MTLVLPGRHLELLELEDPVFQSFFHIKSLAMTNPTGRWAPSFWGVRDDAGCVQVVANFNNDIGEYWEWSEHGYYPPSSSPTKATNSASTTLFMR